MIKKVITATKNSLLGAAVIVYVLLFVRLD